MKNIKGELLRENLKLIDVTKLVLAILVVSIHTLPFYGHEDIFAYKVWWAYAQIAVPFFFMSTGYFIYREYGNSKDGELGSVVKKYLLKYIRIYIIWNLAYLPLAVVHYINSGIDFLQAVKGYVWELVLSGQHYNSWILWYILSSIYALIVLLIISLYKGEKRWILFALSVASLISYIGIHLVKGLAETHSFFRLINGCIYIPMGMLIYDYNQNKMVPRILYIIESCIAILCHLALQLHGGVLSIILELPVWFATTSLFICTITSKINVEFDTTGCRKMSSYIYYLHLWIWTIYYMIVYGEKRFGLDSFIVVTIITTFISALWYRMGERTKINKTTGEPKDYIE